MLTLAVTMLLPWCSLSRLGYIYPGSPLEVAWYSHIFYGDYDSENSSTLVPCLLQYTIVPSCVLPPRDGRVAALVSQCSISNLKGTDLKPTLKCCKSPCRCSETSEAHVSAITVRPLLQAVLPAALITRQLLGDSGAQKVHSYTVHEAEQRQEEPAQRAKSGNLST